MNRAAFRVALASAVVLASSAVFAQLSPAKGIGFKLGDDVQTVKNVLKTEIDPEPMESVGPSSPFTNPNAGKSTLFLRSKGIRVNFAKKGTVESIKFEAPFSGVIEGVKLGDPERKLRELKGNPIKAPWQFGLAQSFLYVLDDTAYIRFDLTDNDGVQSIFIMK